MSLFVLDTDTLTLWLRGHPRVCERIAAHDPSELCTTIVTIEEMLRGWYTQIRRAKSDLQIARAYASLQQTLQIAARLRVLAFDQAAIQRFNELRARKLRVGANDLKIAAIALENQAFLVTRNQSDFQQISDLALEDWSQ
ncbi:MAG: nucleic acid-binding protein [Blastocatellia bacterium AA13]|nr:MAG: nucleic acid-binding protein [Blastocatellia bacterium AA13]